MSWNMNESLEGQMTLVDVPHPPVSKDINLSPNEILSFFGDPKDQKEAAEILEAVGSGIGGAAGIWGLIGSIMALESSAGPIGALVAAITGVVASLGMGIGAIVQRVRAENWTTLVVLNYIEGSTLRVTGFGKDYSLYTISSSEGRTIEEEDVTKTAIASSTALNKGAFILHLLPHGGRSRCRGSLELEITYSNGNKRTMTLHFDNRVGAGQKSTYGVNHGDKKIVSITSNRKTTPTPASNTEGSDLYTLSVQHPDKDQRKDLVAFCLSQS